jgi:hypothetical protein
VTPPEMELRVTAKSVKEKGGWEGKGKENKETTKRKKKRKKERKK